MALEGDTAVMGPQDEKLFTRVIKLAERFGQTIRPMLVFSNDPYYAIAQGAMSMGAQTIVMGSSNKTTIDSQMERLAMTLGALQDDYKPSQPVSVRIQKGTKAISMQLT